jgi:hypothetical protein
VHAVHEVALLKSSCCCRTLTRRTAADTTIVTRCSVSKQLFSKLTSGPT